MSKRKAPQQELRDEDSDSEEDDEETEEDRRMMAAGGEYDEFDDDDEELEAEMAALASSQEGRPRRPDKVLINNSAGIEASIQDFGWVHKAKWIDHMAVSGEAGVKGPEDINDDLARETHFYEQALSSANVAIKRLKDLGIAVKRPDDFYAEMVKSDEHMKRVRAELIFEQTAQETREERRKARENKKYGKQVQAEKLKERTLKKKESIKSIETWRKQRKQNGFEDDGKAPSADFNDPDARKGGGSRGANPGGGRGGDRSASPGGRGGGGQNNFNRSTPESMKKKDFKEEKYGHGGRKRVLKQNDKASSGDMSAYKPSSFDRGIRAGGGLFVGAGGGRAGGRGGRGGGRGGRDGGGRGGGRGRGGR